MKTQDEASARACELIMGHYDLDPAMDENTVIEKYTDQWAWFMQGWQETICVNKI
jgi:hypothetical protein